MSQWRFFFILASFKLTALNIYLKDNFSSGSRSQIILAPPALQHWKKCEIFFLYKIAIKCVITNKNNIWQYLFLWLKFNANACKKLKCLWWHTMYCTVNTQNSRVLPLRGQQVVLPSLTTVGIAEDWGRSVLPRGQCYLSLWITEVDLCATTWPVPLLTWDRCGWSVLPCGQCHHLLGMA